LARDVKGNKKVFYRYMDSKRGVNKNRSTAQQDKRPSDKKQKKVLHIQCGLYFSL